MKKSLISALATLVVGTFVAVVARSAFFPPPPDINMADYNVSGNGDAINNAQFNAAFLRVANGGKIYVPCGTYKLTQTPTVTIASGKHVEFVGGGSDCTIIYMSGAVDGPTFNFGSQWSSVRVAHMSIVTDQHNADRALSFVGAFTNLNPALSAISDITDVFYRGNDAFGANSQNWNVGFYDNSISLINIYGGGFQGIPSPYAGTAVSINGGANSATYAVQVNINSFTASFCATAVSYGDYTQGIQMELNNITECQNGVTTVSNPTATLPLAALLFANNQVNTYSCGICINDAGFANLQVINNQFITNPNGISVKVEGTNFAITGNEFNGVVPPTTTPTATALIIGAIFGNGGIVSGNHFIAYQQAILANPLAQADSLISNNHFSFNTADYAISSVARGIKINDSQPRAYATVPTCNAASALSHYMIYDSPTVTFNASVTVGGSNGFVGMNCDGSRNFVD